MSNDQKQNQQPQTQPRAVESIPVKLLRFAASVDVPGKRGASAVSNDRKHSAYHTIEFFPAIQHHRVTYHSASVGEAPEVAWVPSARVSAWWPA